MRSCVLPVAKARRCLSLETCFSFDTLWTEVVLTQCNARAKLNSLKTRVFRRFQFTTLSESHEISGRNRLTYSQNGRGLSQVKQPRSLTVGQFQKPCAELHEPHRTIALVCVCFGLRISEYLALRWSDVDWLNGKIHVERSIVERNVDDVKTDESRKSLAIAEELLHQLKIWKQSTEFSADSDWILPVLYKSEDCHIPIRAYGGSWAGQAKQQAWVTLGTHTFRHSYRMWIDSIGTPVGVQQKLMRHSDIRTTVNIYGDAATDGRHSRSTQQRLCDWRGRRYEQHGRASNRLKEWLLR